jgi:hypothetical protein
MTGFIDADVAGSRFEHLSLPGTSALRLIGGGCVVASLV